MTDALPLWLIGGFDPTAGAGVLRDTATALMLAPTLPIRTVVTALTRQGHGRPAQTRAPDLDALRWQLDALPPPVAVKVGVVPVAAVPVVVAALQDLEAPIVVDPVLAASDGGQLGTTPEALDPLLSIATVATPNDAELRELSGQPDARAIRDWWMSQHPTAALLHKSAAEVGEQIEDHLLVEGRLEVFQHALQSGPEPRGTGCALATAIACGMAAGQSIPDAVRHATGWVAGCRRHAITTGDESVRLALRPPRT